MKIIKFKKQSQMDEPHVRRTKEMADIHNKLDEQKERDNQFNVNKKKLLENFNRLDQLGKNYFAELDGLFMDLDLTLANFDRKGDMSYYSTLHNHIDALETYVNKAKENLIKTH